MTYISQFFWENRSICIIVPYHVVCIAIHHCIILVLYLKIPLLNTLVALHFAGANIPVEKDDFQLDVSYYDFDKTHNDFAHDSSTTVSKPKYVASPYGEWLAVSDNPTCDSFSDWFRNVPNVNHMVQSTVVLKYLATEQVNR